MGNVYGNGGNRWWVGLNIGETGSQSTIFGTPSIASLNPFTPSGYESLPSGNASDDAQFAKAAIADKSGSPVTISVENINWYNIQGPYSTQAAANAAIPAIEKAHPALGVLGQVAKDNASNPLGTAAGLAGGILNGFSAVISGLSGKNILVRAAKMIIGGVILILGLLKLTGADQSVKGVTAKAVHAAPFL
jgi:hypothetical protein